MWFGPKVDMPNQRVECPQRAQRMSDQSARRRPIDATEEEFVTRTLSSSGWSGARTMRNVLSTTAERFNRSISQVIPWACFSSTARNLRVMASNFPAIVCPAQTGLRPHIAPVEKVPRHLRIIERLHRQVTRGNLSVAEATMIERLATAPACYALECDGDRASCRLRCRQSRGSNRGCYS